MKTTVIGRLALVACLAAVGSPSVGSMLVRAQAPGGPGDKASPGDKGDQEDQGPEFTLRTRVDEVVVPFSVMDGNRLVAGLGPDDFIVLEDGVPQTIEEFSVDPVPLSAVLLIDTGIIPDGFRPLAMSREALIKAFNLTPQHRTLGVADEVAVYRYNNQVTLLNDFTDDEEVLRASLEWMQNFRGGSGPIGGNAPFNSPVINGVPINPTTPSPITGDQRVLNDALYEAALDLRGRDPGRRKVILVLSDGSDKDSATSTEDVRLRLLETEVQVFGIQIEIGLAGLLRRITSPLGDFANFTGGDVYGTAPDKVDPLYPRIANQARSQYVLYYRSTNEAPRDRLVFRRIEIRSRRGYKVYHRAGYYQVPP